VTAHLDEEAAATRQQAASDPSVTSRNVVRSSDSAPADRLDDLDFHRVRRESEPGDDLSHVLSECRRRYKRAFDVVFAAGKIVFGPLDRRFDLGLGRLFELRLVVWGEEDPSTCRGQRRQGQRSQVAI